MATSSMVHMVDVQQNSRQFYWSGHRDYVDSKAETPSGPEVVGVYASAPRYRKGDQTMLYFGSWKSDRLLDMYTDNLLKEMKELQKEVPNEYDDMWIGSTTTLSGTSLTTCPYTVSISGNTYELES